MNRIAIYVLAAACAWLHVAGAQAQDDPKAAVAAIDTVVRKYSNHKAELDPFVEKVYGKFKKNPEVVTAIAKAYYSFSRPKGQPFYTFVTRDSVNAYKYITLAVECDPSYVPAYIHGGDIQRTMGNSEAALSWYSKAITACPYDPSGYLAYADVAIDNDPDGAIGTLERIRDYVPDYPVYLAVARMFDSRADAERAVVYFDKSDKDSMTVDDLVSYAMYHYLLGNFEESLVVSRYGNDKYPANPALNRLTFWNLTDLKEYVEALVYADRLFNKSDNPQIESKDYLYYGYACSGAQKYDEAIEMFSKVASFESATEADKNTAQLQIMFAYESKGDYDKSIELCKAYIDKREKDSLDVTYGLSLLARMYSANVDDSTDVGMASFLKADSVYAVIADRYPAQASFALFQRVSLAYKIDPNSERGVGVPPAKSLVSLIEAMPERDETNNLRLRAACHYLGYYYGYILRRKKQGDLYWTKILAIDPDYRPAKIALGLGD